MGKVGDVRMNAAATGVQTAVQANYLVGGHTGEGYISHAANEEPLHDQPESEHVAQCVVLAAGAERLRSPMRMNTPAAHCSNQHKESGRHSFYLFRTHPVVSACAGLRRIMIQDLEFKE